MVKTFDVRQTSFPGTARKLNEFLFIFNLISAGDYRHSNLFNEDIQKLNFILGACQISEEEFELTSRYFYSDIRLSLMWLLHYPSFLLNNTGFLFCNAINFIVQTTNVAVWLCLAPVVIMLSFVIPEANKYLVDNVVGSLIRSIDSLAAAFVAATYIVANTVMIPANLIIASGIFISGQCGRPTVEDEAKSAATNRQGVAYAGSC